MKQPIDLNNSNAEQKQAYLKELGVNTSSTNDETLNKKILEAEAQLGVDRKAAPSVVGKAEAKAVGSMRKQRRVKILIPSDSQSLGADGVQIDDSVKVSVNGYRCVIPRDIECEVPEAHYKALLNARQTLLVQGKDNEILTRKVQRFPVQFVG